MNPIYGKHAPLCCLTPEPWTMPYDFQGLSSYLLYTIYIYTQTMMPPLKLRPSGRYLIYDQCRYLTGCLVLHGFNSQHRLLSEEHHPPVTRVEVASSCCWWGFHYIGWQPVAFHNVILCKIKSGSLKMIEHLHVFENLWSCHPLVECNLPTYFLGLCNSRGVGKDGRERNRASSCCCGNHHDNESCGSNVDAAILAPKMVICLRKNMWKTAVRNLHQT